jgi:hypothetical protein
MSRFRQAAPTLLPLVSVGALALLVMFLLRRNRPRYLPVMSVPQPVPPPAEPVIAPEPQVAVPPQPVVEAEPEPVAHVEPVVHVEPEPVVHVEPEPVAHLDPEPVAHVEPEPVVHVEPEPAPDQQPTVELWHFQPAEETPDFGEQRWSA